MEDNKLKWYTNKFRRHLCDMHIDDWSDEFLKDFSPENYYELLKKANIQVAMVYLQSHVGYCNWPSKTAKVHRHFVEKENDMKRLIDLCRENDINVVGYYSLNFNNWAHDTHEQWRMINDRGTSARSGRKGYRYGLCCPNNKEYRDFVFKQIDEILDFFEIDGLFFDMLYWPHACYCPSCRERYMKESGKELPLEEQCSVAEWTSFCDSRSAWMGEWAQSVTDYVHKRCPELSVEHNFSAAKAYSLCCRDGVSDASDYVGGDIYGGAREQSFVCGLYRDMSKNQPFEYMTGRCTPGLKVHTVNKTEDELTRQALLTCAHHGAFLIIDAMDPVGTMDERVYDLIGKINEKEAAYEPYLTGTLIEDIGLFYNIDSAINLQTGEGSARAKLGFPATAEMCNNHSAILQASKHLASMHIPFGITTKGKKDIWKKYKAILAPNINNINDDVIDALLEYVKEGGCLYFSNCDCKRLFETLTGGELCGYSDTRMPYIFPAEGYENIIEGYNEKYPLPIETVVPFVKGIDSKNIIAYFKLAYTEHFEEPTRFASIHSNPPGVTTQYPAIAKFTYGKGNVIWCAGSPEFHDGKDYEKILRNLLEMMGLTTYSISSNAPSNVELISFIDKNKIRISAVNVTESNEFFEFPEFDVTVRTSKQIKNVKKLPCKQLVPFVQKDGEVLFRIDKLKIMDMYEIETE